MGRKAQGEQVLQPERRGEVDAVVGHEAHAHSEGGTDEALQHVVGAGERRIGLAELTFEPQMHAALVSHLNHLGERRREEGGGRV